MKKLYLLLSLLICASLSAMDGNPGDVWPALWHFIPKLENGTATYQEVEDILNGEFFHPVIAARVVQALHDPILGQYIDSGATESNLAGLYLLRSFAQQTGIQADQILDAYNAAYPQVFPERDNKKSTLFDLLFSSQGGMVVGVVGLLILYVIKKEKKSPINQIH